ncbi:unnamed protein product [Lampetra planeri]
MLMPWGGSQPCRDGIYLLDKRTVLGKPGQMITPSSEPLLTASREWPLCLCPFAPLVSRVQTSRVDEPLRRLQTSKAFFSVSSVSVTERQTQLV